MRLSVICIMLLSYLCVATPVRAASPQAPAYRIAVAEALYPWTEGLRVTLRVDEDVCKKRYGAQWSNACAASLGEYGAPVWGVKMQPPAAGQWRWIDDMQMAFTPDRPLAPGTRYTVDLTGLPRPSSVILLPAVLRVTTFPLAVRCHRQQLWIDPSPKAAHAFSCTLTFSSPVDTAAMARAIELRASDATSGLRLGTPELIWNQNRDEVLLAAAVKALPRNATSVDVRVAGVPAYTLKNGHPVMAGRGKSRVAAQFRLGVQGTSRLFAVRSLTLTSAQDAQLGREYVLEMETSLHVRPDDVARALLLVQLPRFQTAEATTPYDWSRAPVVAPDALNKGKKLVAEPLQPGAEPAGKLRFRVRADVDSYIFAYLPAEFAAPTGLTLGTPWRGVLRAAPLQADLSFLQPGNVLVLGGERKLDLHATGLTAIRWEALQVRAPFLALLSGENGGSFGDPLAYSVLSFDPLSEAARGEIRLTRTTPGAPQFAALDLDPLLRDATSAGNGKVGLMEVRLVGLDGDREVAEARRLVLVTDLGLLVKKTATGTREVFICSLSKGTPVAGATVRILGANGLPVATARTDAQGHAVLPSVTGLEREKRPVAVVATLEATSRGAGVDTAWLPLNDPARKVDVAAFPTAGRTSAADGVNAFVFSQRGIFRPGETLHFGCLVRRTDWAALPPDMPLLAVLENPAGTVVLRQPFTVGEDGLAELHWPSPENAPTGPYRLDVQLAGRERVVLGTASVRVEEFQPDTLALETHFVPARKAGWLSLERSGGEVHALATLKNLYGLPAVDRRVRASLVVTPATLQFPGYEDYTFHDAAPYRGESLEENLPETRTDAQGAARIALPLQKIRSGTLRCTLLLEGFEPGGGRAVSQRRSVLISPLETVLGYRGTEAGLNLEFIPQGRKAGLEFVALNPALERVPGEALTFVVSGRRFVTSLVTDARGAYRYDETPVDTEIARTTEQLDAQGALRWTIPTGQPGDFLLTVKDSGGVVRASVPFTVAGEALSAGDHLASGKLRLKLDKKEYAAGETIHLALSAPYDGAGLITLERDGVAAKQWFKARAGDSVHAIAIPADFEGKGYVSVSFVRDLASPDIYMQPYACAVAPFTANVRRRDMGLELRAPERVRPGETVEVAVTAAQPGKALVFAVDEGILQLTSFATPSPLDYLLRDRALSVETLQAFDLLMPDHARLKGRIPGFGGGMDLGGGRFHNPFKRRGEPPLTMWSALVAVGPQTTTVRIPVPGYYNGRVRVMAVGSTARAAGNAQRAVTVRGDIILTPQLPLMASPGDVFEGSVAVANNIPGSGKGKKLYLGVDADAALSVTGGTAGIAVDEGGETVVPFRVRVGDAPGEAAIRFRVRSSADLTAPSVQASREASLSVRPATGRRHELTAGKSSTSTDISVPRDLYPYEARVSASVSALPLPAVRGLVRYLDAYPHGCVEQLISRAFPYALLYNRPDLLVDARQDNAALRKSADALLDAAIQAIRAGFVHGEGVGPWPGSAPEEALTVYAGDFLLHLRDAGRGVPGGLADGVFSAIERAVGNTPDSLASARIKAYGIWVLTREGRVTAQAVEQLHTWLAEEVPNWQRDVTASLLAGSCAVMRLDQLAARLVAGVSFDEASFVDEGLFSGLAVQALHTAVLARHFPERLDRGNSAEAMIETAMLCLKQRRYATFSAAQAIRALLAVSGSATPATGAVRLTCAAGAPKNGDAVPMGGLLTLDAPGCTRFRLEMPDSATPWYWQVETDGFDRRPPDTAGNAGMEIRRVYLDAAGKPVTSVALGDEVTVSIEARSHGRPVPNTVMVDLLPGGFEMVLPRAPEDAPAVSPDLVRAERREDRMLLFVRLTPEGFTHTYRIRAVNKGRFALPPAQAEAMYDQSLHAVSAAGVLEVR